MKKPKLLPGQEPYTEEELKQLDSIVQDAADGDPGELNEPALGTWASVARIMAAGDDSGFDWDAWKDEMKEGDL